jgi:hypothetical protein
MGSARIGVRVHTYIHTGSHISKEEQEDRLLVTLPYAASATFNDCRWEHESLCLAGTRSQLLADIMSRAHSTVGAGNAASGSSGGLASGTDSDSASLQYIFWLDSMAGTSKSTIARMVRRRCSDAGVLGASFFFSLGSGKLEAAHTFVMTLAVQLARRHPLLRMAVCMAVHA